MRSYDVAVTSLAINAPQKWVDNVLSQHPIPEVGGTRRGVGRRIPYQALVRLALVRELHLALGTSVREAVLLAATLLDPASGGVHVRGPLRVTFDRLALEQTLNERLREALESAPISTRGRRPQRSGRPDGEPTPDIK